MKGEVKYGPCGRLTFLRTQSILLGLLFLLLPPCPSDAVQYWGDGVFADFGFSAKSTLPTDTPYEGSLGIRKILEEAAFYAGFCVDDFGLDVSASFLGEPLEARWYSLGLKYLTHLSRSFVTELNPDLVTWENLFLVTNTFVWGGRNPLTILINAGLYVSRSFLQLSSGRLEFQESSLAIEFQLTKRFLDRHECMFRSATFDPLHFRGFINIWWQLGYSFDISGRISLGCAAEAVHTDQVFLSGTLSGVQGKIFVVCRL